MNVTKHALTMIVLMLCCHTSIATTDTLPSSDTKPLIVMNKQPTVSIRLKSNPTTGYRWFIRSYPPDFVVPVTHRVEKPTSTLVGAPTQEVFEFKLKPVAFKAPHQFIIRFSYFRPFESNGKVETKSFKIITDQ